jgi:hypothetical protein
MTWRTRLWLISLRQRWTFKKWFLMEEMITYLWTDINFWPPDVSSEEEMCLAMLKVLRTLYDINVCRQCCSCDTMAVSITTPSIMILNIMTPCMTTKNANPSITTCCGNAECCYAGCCLCWVSHLSPLHQVSLWWMSWRHGCLYFSVVKSPIDFW